MQKIRILIAGTRRTSFQVLARMLERASGDYDVLGQVQDEAQACTMLRENEVDVVLVDASAPDAFEFCGRLTEEFRNLCVLFVGGRRSYEWLKRAMDVGARGYISEDECTGECIRMEISRARRGYIGDNSMPLRILPKNVLAGKSRIIVRAVDFIRKNYVRNISVTEAAEYVGISESHLRRCFRQEMDMSFVDFLTKYRIDTAKALMDREEMPIQRVSDETGFSSARYFCRVFKKVTGMTPKEYMLKQGRGGCE